MDIECVNITVTSAEAASAKGKGKARTEGTELLSNAKLRLKAGQRYALVGKNGSGKSSEPANWKLQATDGANSRSQPC